MTFLWLSWQAEAARTVRPQLCTSYGGVPRWCSLRTGLSVIKGSDPAMPHGRLPAAMPPMMTPAAWSVGYIARHVRELRPTRLRGGANALLGARIARVQLLDGSPDVPPGAAYGAAILTAKERTTLVSREGPFRTEVVQNTQSAGWPDTRARLGGTAFAVLRLIRQVDVPTPRLRTPCAAAWRKPPRSDVPRGTAVVNV